MATTARSTVVGVFSDRSMAEHAVQDHVGNHARADVPRAEDSDATSFHVRRWTALSCDTVCRGLAPPPMRLWREAFRVKCR